MTSTDVDAKRRKGRRTRGAVLASAAALGLLAAGGTVATAMDVTDMAHLNGNPITCTEVQKDPRQTDPPFASGGQSDGQSNGVSWTYTTANRNIWLTFLSTYDASSSRVAAIIVKVNNDYAVCDLGRDAAVGDVVAINSTDETSAISWVKLQEASDPDPTPSPTGTEEPEPTPTPTETLPEEPEPTPSPTQTLPEEPEPTPSPTLFEEPGPTSTPTETLPADERSTLGADPALSADPAVTQSAATARSLASTGAEARTLGLLTGALVLLGVVVTLVARHRTARSN